MSTAPTFARETSQRIWQRDSNLWKPGDAHHAGVIANRLGWLDVIATMEAEVTRIENLYKTALAENVRDVVLLGMGGSSLCPEVIRTSFPHPQNAPRLHVLDTTDPVAINATAATIDPQTTWFIVASKSGTTLETLSHFAYFWNRVSGSVGDGAGRHFIAISDPESALVALAKQHQFREVFENPSDIGGRYSALSFFGLVPGALSGIDVAQLLARGAATREACHADDGARNPGLQLGTTIAEHAAAGRDKLTIIAPPPITEFSLWAEQLIAESTGKEGKGVIPIGDEPIGAPDAYGTDRFFVYLRLDGNPEFDDAVAKLENAGHPVEKLELKDVYDLGAEFFRWEFAVACVGAALQIDPFDEPNVQESKDNTKRVLAEYESSGTWPAQDGGGEDAIANVLEELDTGDYVAIMAYVTPTDVNYAALQAFRVAIRNQHRVATTLGFGPRFLHSTGQLHKGGPNTGVFIQFTQHDTEDADIPGQKFSFSTLKKAQAIGDLASLRSHHRRATDVDLGEDVAGNVARLTSKLTRSRDS